MSTANLIRVYLKNKPYMIEALENGIVNLSALSRVIQKELKINDYFAVKAAVRRYYQHLEKAKLSIEQRALSVLKGNRITILDGISVLVTSKDIEIVNRAKIKIDNYYIYLIDSNVLAKTRIKTDIIHKFENCSAIVIHSEENVENVSGVMAFVTSLFAEYNINIIELISCYTENILVIRREDTLKGYELLSEIVK
jgi:hypothetical protein